MTLEDIYTAEWFAHDFTDLQPEFDVVADAIYRQFHPTHVVDVGCGPGMLLQRFYAHGCIVRGVEGSAHGIKMACVVCRPNVALSIQHADITKMTWLTRMPSQVVICTEVAEHLDERHADGLVALLCSAMCPIIFTAAGPGQDGHHHVNCQPLEYWSEKFCALGAFPDHPARFELQCRWSGLKRLSHMPRNLQVYR